MPFKELPGQGNSWPPTLLRMSSTPEIIITTPSPSHSPPSDACEPASAAIDENPFSFFLDSDDKYDDGEVDLGDPDEFFYHDTELYVHSDLDDDEDLSAGIETPDSEMDLEAVREISPSSLQRAIKELDLGQEVEQGHVFGEEDEDTVFGMAMPLTLRDFSKRFSDSKDDGRQSRTEIARSNSRKEEMGRGLDISVFKEKEMKDFTIRRGRSVVRLTPSSNSEGRGQTRSLSVRKPPSWKLPSRGIWRIEEEDEEKKGEEAISTSAPTRMGILIAPGSPRRRSAKKVHWVE